jgi:hypothetical protein
LAILISSLAAAAADPALLNLVMPDARILAGVDVEQAKNSPFGQFVLSQMTEDKDFTDFVATTGFDPRRHLQEVLLASTTVGNEHGKGLIVARGVFDKNRIIATAKNEGAASTSYNGVDVLTPPNKEGRTVWIAFLDSSVLVIGDDANVRGALDRRTASRGLAPDISAKVSDLSRHNDVWMVSHGGFQNITRRLPEEQVGGAIRGEFFEAVEQTSGGIKFGTTVQISGEAVTKTPKDATALADVMRFLAGLVQMNSSKQGAAALARVLETLDLKAENNIMRFTVSVPQAQIEELIKSKPRARKSATI